MNLNIENFEGNIIKTIDMLVTEFFLSNEKISTMKIKNSSSNFIRKSKETISLIRYLERIKKRTNCSEKIILIGFYYLNLFFKKKKIDFSSLSFHKLLFISIMISLKFFEDENYEFSIIGGIPSKEITKLEIEMLKTLEFNLYIKPVEFSNFLGIVFKFYLNFCCWHWKNNIFPKNFKNVIINYCVCLFFF